MTHPKGSVFQYVGEQKSNVNTPKPLTNWGKRTSDEFLKKVEQLRENKVDPSYLKVTKPNFMTKNSIITDSI